MKKLRLLFIGLSLFAGLAFADAVEMIELKHRPAADLIPILKPMLDESGSITGNGFQLMVRTSSQNLHQIKQLVNKLDVAPQQLLISVFQGNDRDLRAIGVSGGMQYQDNNLSSRAGNTSTRDGGGSARYSTRDATASVNAISTRGRLKDNPIHQLRITEGSEGYIETGKSIPYFSGGVWLGGRRGAGVDAGVDYKDIHTGFYVLPRLHDDQVTLDVSPYKQTESKTQGGAIETQSASTTIRGKVGEWIPVGGVTEETSRTGSSSTSYASTQSRRNESIWIKADLVH